MTLSPEAAAMLRRDAPRGLVVADGPDPVSRQMLAVVSSPWVDSRGFTWADGSLLLLWPEEYRSLRGLGVVDRFTVPREFRGRPYRHALSLCGRLVGTLDRVPAEDRPRGRAPKAAEYVPEALPIGPLVAPKRGCGGCGQRSPTS